MIPSTYPISHDHNTNSSMQSSSSYSAAQVLGEAPVHRQQQGKRCHQQLSPSSPLQQHSFTFASSSTTSSGSSKKILPARPTSSSSASHGGTSNKNAAASSDSRPSPARRISIPDFSKLNLLGGNNSSSTSSGVSKRPTSPRIAGAPPPSSYIAPFNGQDASAMGPPPPPSSYKGAKAQQTQQPQAQPQSRHRLSIARYSASGKSFIASAIDGAGAGSVGGAGNDSGSIPTSTPADKSNTATVVYNPLAPVPLTSPPTSTTTASPSLSTSISLNSPSTLASPSMTTGGAGAGVGIQNKETVQVLASGYDVRVPDFESMLRNDDLVVHVDLTAVPPSASGVEGEDGIGGTVEKKQLLATVPAPAPSAAQMIPSASSSSLSTGMLGKKSKDKDSTPIGIGITTVTTTREDVIVGGLPTTSAFPNLEHMAHVKAQSQSLAQSQSAYSSSHGHSHDQGHAARSRSNSSMAPQPHAHANDHHHHPQHQQPKKPVEEMTEAEKIQHEYALKVSSSEAEAFAREVARVEQEEDKGSIIGHADWDTIFPNNAVGAGVGVGGSRISGGLVPGEEFSIDRHGQKRRASWKGFGGGGGSSSSSHSQANSSALASSQGGGPVVLPGLGGFSRGMGFTLDALDRATDPSSNTPVLSSGTASSRRKKSVSAGVAAVAEEEGGDQGLAEGVTTGRESQIKRAKSKVKSLAAAFGSFAAGHLNPSDTVDGSGGTGKNGVMLHEMQHILALSAATPSPAVQQAQMSQSQSMRGLPSQAMTGTINTSPDTGTLVANGNNSTGKTKRRSKLISRSASLGNIFGMVELATPSSPGGGAPVDEKADVIEVEATQPETARPLPPVPGPSASHLRARTDVQDITTDEVFTISRKPYGLRASSPYVPGFDNQQHDQPARSGGAQAAQPFSGISITTSTVTTTTVTDTSSPSLIPFRRLSLPKAVTPVVTSTTSRPSSASKRIPPPALHSPELRAEHGSSSSASSAADHPHHHPYQPQLQLWNSTSNSSAGSMSLLTSPSESVESPSVTTPTSAGSHGAIKRKGSRALPPIPAGDDTSREEIVIQQQTMKQQAQEAEEEGSREEIMSSPPLRGGYPRQRARSRPRRPLPSIEPVLDYANEQKIVDAEMPAFLAAPQREIRHNAEAGSLSSSDDAAHTSTNPQILHHQPSSSIPTNLMLTKQQRRLMAMGETPSGASSASTSSVSLTTSTTSFSSSGNRVKPPAAGLAGGSSAASLTRYAVLEQQNKRIGMVILPTETAWQKYEQERQRLAFRPRSIGSSLSVGGSASSKAKTGLPKGGHVILDRDGEMIYVAKRTRGLAAGGGVKTVLHRASPRGGRASETVGKKGKDGSGSLVVLGPALMRSNQNAFSNYRAATLQRVVEKRQRQQQQAKTSDQRNSSSSLRGWSGSITRADVFGQRWSFRLPSSREILRARFKRPQLQQAKAKFDDHQGDASFFNLSDDESDEEEDEEAWDGIAASDDEGSQSTSSQYHMQSQAPAAIRQHPFAGGDIAGPTTLATSRKAKSLASMSSRIRRDRYKRMAGYGGGTLSSSGRPGIPWGVASIRELAYEEGEEEEGVILPETNHVTVNAAGMKDGSEVYEWVGAHVIKLVQRASLSVPVDGGARVGGEEQEEQEGDGYLQVAPRGREAATAASYNRDRVVAVFKRDLDEFRGGGELEVDADFPDVELLVMTLLHVLDWHCHGDVKDTHG